MKKFWDNLDKYWKRITLGITIIALLTGSGMTISSIIDWSVDVTKAPKAIENQSKIIDSLSNELKIAYLYIEYYEKYFEAVHSTFQSILPLKDAGKYFYMNENKERIQVNIRISPSKEIFVFVPKVGIFECQWSNRDQKYYFYDYMNKLNYIEKRK